MKLGSVVLFVRDVQKSRSFYEGLLGLSVEQDNNVNIAYPGFAIWQADHAEEQIFHRKADLNRKLACENLEVYFETEELDVTFTKLKAAGVKLVHEIEVEPWGQRVFRVLDPDGHVVEFGEPM